MDDRSLTDRINDLTGPVCAWCDKPLAGGVSDDFCSPEHQQEWTAYRNDVDELTGYREAASPILGISDAMNTERGDLDMTTALRAVFADMERDLAEIDARHGGTYEGGPFAAFPVPFHNIPAVAAGNDNDCGSFWASASSRFVGVGTTPAKAAADMKRRTKGADPAIIREAFYSWTARQRA